MKNENKHLLITLFFILVIDAMNFGIIIPVLGVLFLDPLQGFLPASASMNYRFGVMSLALGLYPLAVCLGTPLLGMFSDRIGRKPVLFIALLATVVGLMLTGVAILRQSIFLFLTGRIITGFSSASQPIAQAATADITEQANRPIYFSVVALAMTLGMLLGPLLGGFFSNPRFFHWANLMTPFWLASALALFNLTLMLISFKETFSLSPERKIKGRHEVKLYLKRCTTYFMNRHFLMLIIIFFALELAWSLFFQSSSLILKTRFLYDSAMQSIYISFLGIVMCFGLAVLFKPLTKRFNLKQILVFSLTLCALGYFLTLFSKSEGIFWLATMPFTLGVGLAYTAIMAMLSLLIDPAEQGWLMGFMMALLALAWAISGFLIPTFISVFENLIFLICFMVTCFAIVCFFFGFQKKRSQRSMAW